MRTHLWLACVGVVVLLGSLSAPEVLGIPVAQEGVATEQDAPSEIDKQEQKPPQVDSEPVALTDAERLLRLGRILELDQAKLTEVREELERRQSFFERLGEITKARVLELQEKQQQLGELGDAGDPDQRSAIEAEIAELETEVDLFKTQADLALTGESTVRQQIEALEKKLEREQRAIDVLRGVSPAGPSPAPGEMVQIPAATPAEPPTGLPGIPGVPTAVIEPRQQPTVTRLETTAQVEALRELERLQEEVGRAELAVVEFVKRKESLQQQIGFEETLLETAQRSNDNLSRALEIRRDQLAAKTAAGAGPQELRPVERSIEGIEELLSETLGEIENRGRYIDSLKERLEGIQVDEARVVQEVEDRRKQAKRARDKLYWLESPMHPRNVGRWLRERGPRILLVIAVGAFLLLLLKLTVRRVAGLTIRQSRGERALRSNRADTVALSFRSAMSALIVVGAVLLVFQEAGFDIKTVLGGAAILGFAIAFGAQNLMRDYFTGFMILLEDQYELGDLITIGNITGTVERVNMRTTVLRDLEGRVHFIPNGEVKSVTNRTYVWGRAVIEVPIGYKEDVDRVMELLLQLAKELRSDPEYAEFVTDDPVMLGVDKFTEYGVVLKFMLKTQPEKMFAIRREMLRRIKKRFDEVGVQISVPHRVVLQQQAEDSF